MKKTDIKLITVGELVKELKRYEKECSDYVVNINIPDGSTLNIMGTMLDNEGDLCIDVDEDPDEGYYNIMELLDELNGYNKETRVYVKGCGLYLTFNVNPKGSLYLTDNNEDETVEFDAYAFDDYEYEPSGWPLSEATKRKLAEEARLKTRQSRRETIALIVLAAGSFIGLCYNVYALVTHSSRHAVWENILWIVGFIVILIVCWGTLYYSKDKK